MKHLGGSDRRFVEDSYNLHNIMGSSLSSNRDPMTTSATTAMLRPDSSTELRINKVTATTRALDCTFIL
jgi:hypothetical protein